MERIGEKAKETSIKKKQQLGNILMEELNKTEISVLEKPVYLVPSRL